MVHNIYRISLKLKTPSAEGKKINFKENEDDLFDALHEFNMKYRSWSKRLILTNIENNFFDILLVIEKHKDKVSTREIRSFTAYLNKEKNWSVYSRDPSKLFEGIKFSNISLDEAKEIITNIESSTKLYSLQEENIKFLLQTKSNINPKDINQEKSDLFLGINEELSDEQALAIFDYLLKTKLMGNNYEKKKETISQIKDMLFKWI